NAAMGFSYGTRTCYVTDELNGNAHMRSRFDAPDARWYITAPTDISGPATKVIEGNTVTLSATSPLLTSPYACMAVFTRYPGEEEDKMGSPIDTAFAALPRPVAAPTPTPPPAAQDGRPQIALDRDRDAVPDATDKCPDVAGAGTDGCLTTPVAKALKLGTKRLVVDHLMERTGPKCPPAVKATVSASGRTLAKQKLGVIAKGSWCHVTGVVKLKKRAKKVRVVIAGTGVASIKQVVAKG
ncbi:MAG: hypothetical protein Q7T55_01635, partial [Solirubrobacteraceae bacterium]|nr:hypothetical protein [Solirubrobacteraceae bacterium]